MRKARALAASVFISSISSQALAVEWVEAGRADTTTYYVDIESISKNETTASARVKRVWDDNPDGWYESILLEVHDCFRHRLKITLMQSHHRSGAVSELTIGNGLPGKWEKIAPAPATMHHIHAQICEYQANNIPPS